MREGTISFVVYKPLAIGNYLLLISPGVPGLLCGQTLLSSDWEVEMFVEEFLCVLLYFGLAVGVWLPLS